MTSFIVSYMPDGWSLRTDCHRCWIANSIDTMFSSVIVMLVRSTSGDLLLALSSSMLCSCFCKIRSNAGFSIPTWFSNLDAIMFLHLQSNSYG
ncbi:hypothetical protein OIU76_027990 [Salix suchowensis]|nr:hypothetical protein OIU76_027990 [Salix suchowensis]